MSIIIEIEDDEVFRLYNYYHKACFPHWKEGDIHEVNAIEERRKCWECQEWIEAELEMQALDDDIEAKMQRKADEQAEQNYYAQCAAEGYSPCEHDRSCTCPECEGDPDEAADPIREMKMIESATWKKYLEGDLDPRKQEF